MGKTFGLIGKTLSHSFSKNYFEKKFSELDLKDHHYLNFEMEAIGQFKQIIETNTSLRGLNVTVPYKESIVPLLDELTVEAQAIGAVNCIEFREDKLIGHNTDHYGFKQSIKPFLEPGHERALILGTGGSSKAVAFALRSVGVEVYFVSQSKKGQNHFSYDELNEYIMKGFKLIVNTSPVGMFPDVNAAPALPYMFITEEHLCYDLIYNPAETLFLRKSKEQGAVVMNGLSMLHLQAEKSWEIWNS